MSDRLLGYMQDGVFHPLSFVELDTEWWAMEHDSHLLNLRIQIARYDLDYAPFPIAVIDGILSKARRDLIEAAVRRPYAPVKEGASDDQ